MFSLYDHELFQASGKHALVDFPGCGLRLSGASLSLSQAYVSIQYGVCAADKTMLSSSRFLSQNAVALIVSVTVLLGVITAGIAVYAYVYRKR